MFKKDTRILFLGTPDIAAYVLEALILNNYNIVGIVSQIDKKRDRKGNLISTPTRLIGEKYNIPVYEFEKLKDNIDKIKEISPELVLTLAYGQIVPKEFLDIPKLGCINLHGSLLPKYRGAAPIQRVLYNGESVTGFTLMEMVEKMDAGRMYASRVIKIEENDNYSSLLEKMKECAKDLILASIDDYIDGKLVGIPQDEEEVTFANKILREDEKLDINDDFVTLNNKIRALSYFPGPFLVLNNENIKIFKIHKVSDKKCNDNLGEILEASKKGIYVQLNNEVISIDELQKPGKKIMKAVDFVNGNRDLVGKKFE